MKGIINSFSKFFHWCFDFPNKHGKTVFDCMFLAIGFLFKVLLGLLVVGVMIACLIGLPALVLHLIGII